MVEMPWFVILFIGALGGFIAGAVVGLIATASYYTKNMRKLLAASSDPAMRRHFGNREEGEL